jgi:hypothetical protein
VRCAVKVAPHPFIVINEGEVSYVVDTNDRVWLIKDFFDEDGEECDEVDAVTATIYHRDFGIGVAHLNLMEEPTLQ